MKLVTPPADEDREQYADDKTKMNQAMMDLGDKTEKLKPHLGGCLPILVQIRCSVALYWVLFESSSCATSVLSLGEGSFRAGPWYVLRR